MCIVGMRTSCFIFCNEVLLHILDSSCLRICPLSFSLRPHVALHQPGHPDVYRMFRDPPGAGRSLLQNPVTNTRCSQHLRALGSCLIFDFTECISTDSLALTLTLFIWFALDSFDSPFMLEIFIGFAQIAWALWEPFHMHDFSPKHFWPAI